MDLVTQRSGAAARIFAMVELIARTDAELGVRAIARRTGIDKSAVSRTLQQLAGLEILEPGLAAGRYRIGPRLFALSGAVAGRDNLIVAARPTLTALTDRFNETTYITVLEGAAVVFKDKVDCSHAIRYVIDLGVASPLHAGAGGRAILAGVAPNDLERMLPPGPLPALTPRTTTNRDDVIRRAIADGAEGYAVSVGERTIGGAGVGAPYFGADGRCRGSIVVNMPESRFGAARASEIGLALVSAAADLSTRLGADAMTGVGR
jgi:DNA-binding IclR family transcriptional regulator